MGNRRFIPMEAALLDWLGPYRKEEGLVLEEFATYSPVAHLLRWLGGDPSIQIGGHAVVNLQAIEHVTHYGDGLYRERLRDRASTEITASRAGAARLASVLKTER